MEKKYHVNGWRGKEYDLTAKELYDRVMEDSKSNYDWIASATELVRICREPDFPKQYANEIKIAILNCFANLENYKEVESYREPTVDESVSYCYHSISDASEKAKEAKENYLKAIIGAIIKYDRISCRLPIHFGPAYQKVCEQWQKEKFNEYVTRKEIDFQKMQDYLYTDFDKTIEEAEKKGIFGADDEKKYEKMRKFWASFDI